MINPDRFRSFIEDMKNDEEKAKSLNVRAAKMGQGASGYLVPIKSIVNTDVVKCQMRIA